LRLEIKRYIISLVIEYGDNKGDDLIEAEFMGEDPVDFPTLKELGLGMTFKGKIGYWMERKIGFPEKIVFLNGATIASVAFLSTQSSVYGVLAGGLAMGISYSLVSFFQSRTKNTPQQN